MEPTQFIKRYIELPEELVKLLDAEAEAMKRSPKSHLEFLIEPLLIERYKSSERRKSETKEVASRNK